MGEPWGGREPRRWQAEAVDAALGAMRQGTRRPLIHACTGAGKSIVIAELAARCTGSVLVTTPTQALVWQLGATIRARCGDSDVGLAFQHAFEVDRRVVVTCIPSLGSVVEARPTWDCWIGDEAHRLEGDTVRQVRESLTPRVAVGMTATPFRADNKGLELWDDLVYSYPSARAVEDGVLVPWRVVRWDGMGERDTDVVCARWVGEAEGPGIVSALDIGDAERFASLLDGLGIPALSIHGRLPRREQLRRLEELQAGRLRALVHCQLLTEGIDLPWLRWLCLRRPVSSPVRLVQEVGRVLRCAPGKSSAVLYDPHDCLGAVGLVHAAALEDAQRGARNQKDGEEWSIPELEGLGEVSRLPEPVAVDTLSGWATDLLGALRGAGIAPPPDEREAGPWREKKASERQIAALGRMSWTARYLPDPAHRKAIRWILDRPSLRRGTASDLFEVFRALAEGSADARRNKRHWHCPVSIPEVPNAADS